MDIINKFLPIVLSILMSANLAGCGDSVSATNNSSVNTEKSSSNVTIDTSDGWSHEELTSVMYLCGEPFSLPCTFEDLPKGLVIDTDEEELYTKEKGRYLKENTVDGTYRVALITYNGEGVGNIAYFNDATGNEVVFRVQWFSYKPFNVEYLKKHEFEIFGFTSNSDFDDFSKTFVNVEREDYVMSVFKTNDIEYPNEKVVIVSSPNDEYIMDLSYFVYEPVKTTKTNGGE